MSGTDALRVLQVLGTTDVDDDAIAALDLHRGLSRTGVEVRTLALAPGRAGGLGSVVPVMAPSVRSLAAHTQLRREQRWADAVVLRGAVPAASAGLLPAKWGPALHIHLTAESDAFQRVAAPSGVRRLIGRGAAIVVTHGGARAVAPVLGVEPSEVSVIPYGIDVSPGATADAERRRTAAREALGLAPDATVVLVCGDDPSEPDHVGEVRRLGAVPLTGPASAGPSATPVERVRFGTGTSRSDDGAPEVIPELHLAAADIVFAPTAQPWGPSPLLLRGAAAGLAVVATPEGATGDLVDGGTGWASLEHAVGSGRAEMHRRGAAAADRVASRFASHDVVERWTALLQQSVGR